MRPADDDLLIGVYYDTQRTEEVSDALRDHGFLDSQIRVTICETELDPAGRKTRRCLLAFVILGALLGLCLGLSVGRLAPFPIAAACMCLLSGAFVGYLAALVQRSQSHSASVFRGIITVRPDGRDEEAAAILLQFAGCARTQRPAARSA